MEEGGERSHSGFKEQEKKKKERKKANQKMECWVSTGLAHKQISQRCGWWMLSERPVNCYL